MKNSQTSGPYISAKALGLLFGIVTSGSNPSAECLAQLFKEGERSIQTGLKELRALGLLVTKRIQTAEGYWVTNSKVTALGFKLLQENLESIEYGGDTWVGLMWPDNELLSKAANWFHRPLGGSLAALNHNGLMTSTNEEYFNLTPEEVEANNLRIKERELKAIKKFREREEYKLTSRMQRRNLKKQKDWTATDSSFEFADRIFKIWHIAPWEVTKSKFTPALSEARIKHETNGEIEYLMMELFFEQTRIVELISNLTDANSIWRLFINHFGRLAHEVKYFMPSGLREFIEAWSEDFERLQRRALMSTIKIENERGRLIRPWAQEAREKGLWPHSEEYLDRKSELELSVLPK